jgi:hypothetical protein
VSRLIGQDSARQALVARISELGRRPRDQQVAAASLLFAGPEGSGRRAVARLYAHALAEAGVIPSGVLHRHALSDFPARWDAQPGVFATAIFAEAAGGLLLLEADPVFTQWPADEQAWVLTAVADVAGKHPAVPVVLSGDPGYLARATGQHDVLSRCFTGSITFVDYAAVELAELARRYLVRRGFELPPEACRALVACFTSAPPGTTVWHAHQFAAYVAETAGSPVIAAGDLYPEQPSSADDPGPGDDHGPAVNPGSAGGPGVPSSALVAS